MATLYSDKRYNGAGTCWWRLRVDYSGTTATAYVDVGPSGWSIWLRFTTGTNTFSKSANTYYASNNGGSSNKLGSITISETSATTITQTCSGSTWGGTVNGACSVTIPVQKGSFNLNVLLPDGSEPYSTGAAGSVEFSSNGGSSYTRLYNEPSSSYSIGTSFVCRNFTPGTGLHLSTTSGFNSNGGSGPWYATQGSSTTLTFRTAWNTYTIAYNANGGSGAPGSQTKTYGTNLTLSSTKPSRTGYTFLGWSTSSSASSASYSAGATLSSDLTSTNGATIILYAVWSINSYYLDLNGWLDGAESSGISPYGMVDIIVNGSTVGSGVADYYTQHTYGSSYSITNIRANSGYQYNGVHSGSLSGTIGAATTVVVLDYSTSKPSALNITGTVQGPFEIDLSWSATGLNITNYTVYANGTQIYSGTDTSFVFSCAEETTYNIYFTATNVGGTTTSDTITLTTPADQAKIRIKKDGAWQKGKAYYKKDGTWVKAKKIYIKVDGKWKINNNYDN